MQTNAFTAGDIYIRYLSYNTAELLKADLVKRLPIKIDIGTRTAAAARFFFTTRASPHLHTFPGAVYSTPPKDRAFNGDMFFPVERELVSALPGSLFSSCAFSAFLPCSGL